MMTEFSKMLEEYRNGERGLPTYDELAAMLDNPTPVRVFQSPEQNEQLARDAQAVLDAEMRGVGFLVDGVSVHPSRVTVLRSAALPTASIVRQVYAAAKELHFHSTDEEFILGAGVECALIQMCELGVGGREQPVSEMYEMHKLVGTLENEIRNAAISAVLDRLEKLLDKAAPAAQGTPVQPVAVPDGPSAEDYSDMLREFFCSYSAGGYNDADSLVPLARAKDKLQWVVANAETRGLTAPAAQVDALQAAPLQFRCEGAIFNCNGAENPVSYGPTGVRVDLSGWTCYAPGTGPVQPGTVPDAKDAERYLVLRNSDVLLEDVYVWDERGEKYQETGKYIGGADLDAAIDAAIAAKAAS